MRALPTRFDGITFRSRLEADWAATLKSWGMAYIYEPEGYQLLSGAYYSPDFYLPESHVWLEVKGAHNERIGLVDEFDSSLTVAWERETNGANDRYDPKAPLVVVGREPQWIETPHWDVDGIWAMQWQGVFGFEVILADCKACESTLFCMRQPYGTPRGSCPRGCRKCGARWNCRDGPRDFEARMPWHCDFIRLPRPAGKQ